MDIKELFGMLYNFLIYRNIIYLKKSGKNINEYMYLVIVIVIILFSVFLGLYFSLSIRGIVFLIFIYLGAAFSLPKIWYENLIEKIEKNIPKALYIMIITLESGRSINEALEEVVKSNIKGVSPIFNKVLLLMEKQKLRFEEAITLVSSFYDSLILRMLTRIIIENKKYGGDLANSLRILAKTLENFSLYKRQLLSVTASGIATGIVILCLVVPAIGGLLGGYISAISVYMSEIGKGTLQNPKLFSVGLEIVEFGTAIIGSLMAIAIFGIKLERMFLVAAITMTVGMIAYYGLYKAAGFIFT